MIKTVLIVDDDPTQRRLLRAVIERNHLKAKEVASGEEAIELFLSPEGDKIDVALLDIVMEKLSGIEVLKTLRAKGVETPVIVQTSQGSIDTVITAMQSGAQDFIIKPASPERLWVSIQNALQIKTLTNEVKKLQKKSNNRSDFNSFIGKSEEIQQIIAMGRRGAKSNIPILLLGESGVGKEIFARAIQGESERSGKPFITVNCGAIPANLVESLLFGHEKGSFTGATTRHTGKFKEADGGTLFLDEVGELPLDMQVKLLRVLQEGEIDPIGAKTSQKVDVRILSATNCDLMEQVKAGEFREDLYYRLNVFPITIPPLKDRAEDIVLLSQYFIDQFNLQEKRKIQGLTEETLEMLKNFPWPGNVRQLENAIFRAIILCEETHLHPYDFPGISGERPPLKSLNSSDPTLCGAQGQTEKIVGETRFKELSPQGMSGNIPFEIQNSKGHLRSLEEIEHDMIAYALKVYAGHMSETARRLGIGRSTLYRKIREHNLQEGLLNKEEEIRANL